MAGFSMVKSGLYLKGYLFREKPAGILLAEIFHGEQCDICHQSSPQKPFAQPFVLQKLQQFP